MATPLLNFAGKTALITGASSGIGYATAILFKRLGASILATGRNSTQLDKLVNELTALKTEGVVHTVLADITKEEDVQQIVQYVSNTLNNKVDVLVNNAGILESGSIENTSMEQFDRVMNINLRSVYHLTMKMVPLLIQTKGSVVNVSSVNGMRSFPNVLAYNISKSGVDQFTRCIALELASKGVRVNSVNPGVTVTDLHRRSGMDESAYQLFLQRSKETHALGRPGSVDEVASAIAFLASDAASFITGVNLPVDGGRHAMCAR